MSIAGRVAGTSDDGTWDIFAVSNLYSGRLCPPTVVSQAVSIRVRALRAAVVRAIEVKCVILSELHPQSMLPYADKPSMAAVRSSRGRERTCILPPPQPLEQPERSLISS